MTGGGALSGRSRDANGNTTMNERKRIAILSEDMVEPWDEGIKKFAYSIARALYERADVLPVNVARSGVGGDAAEKISGTRTFLNPNLRKKLRTFSPHMVLYIPSPSSTLGSFFRARVLRSYSPRATHGMVAMIPRRHGAIWNPLLRLAAPDVIFVPSYASLLYLKRRGMSCELIPFGVDLDVFKAGDHEERTLLRNKYRIAMDAFVFLHVGHLSRKRLVVLKKRVPDVEVIVIASTSTPEDRMLRREMEAAGIRVIREYVPVEEYYRLADCYVFPVEEIEGSVELPLSVLESLASKLPVLTTSFGGLRDFFPEGPDVIYWKNSTELAAKAVLLRNGDRPMTRSMERFSWASIAGLILETLE
jgi:glycosyltransferase involved in cell wall biosynthesis